MKRLLAATVAGIFFLVSPEPGQAQKEVQPPPISPMLEGPRPLEKPETKEPAPPSKSASKKKDEKASKGKSSKNQKKANLNKQQTAKKKQAAANKKKNQKTSKKKRPAETPQAGPEEG